MDVNEKRKQQDQQKARRAIPQHAHQEARRVARNLMRMKPKPR